MQAITTYDEKAIKVLNRYSVIQLAKFCYVCNSKVDVNNGVITGATRTHRDYVSVHDGRNMYKEGVK